MGIEDFKKQEPFENTPLGVFASKENQPEKYTLQTEDGYSVSIDTKRHPDGTTVTLTKDGVTTSFLVIEDKLYNAEVEHYDKVIDSIDAQSDKKTIDVHALKLLDLIEADLIKS